MAYLCSLRTAWWSFLEVCLDQQSRDNETLIASLQRLPKAENTLLPFIAAPIVLERAGLLEGRKFTCFPDVELKFASGDQTDLVVMDGNNH